LEAEDIPSNRLADDQLLNSADVPHLPVALRAIRMCVVAVDTSLLHDDWRDEAHPVGEDRRGDVGQLLVRVYAQRGERAAVEIVQGMRRPAIERIVGHEAVGYVRLLLTDHPTEFQ